MQNPLPILNMPSQKLDFLFFYNLTYAGRALLMDAEAEAKSKVQKAENLRQCQSLLSMRSASLALSLPLSPYAYQWVHVCVCV